MDFREIRRRFGFHSIQVGRWVSRTENEQAGVLFYDALCDLMVILSGCETLISLRGSLSLAYGTGGRPGVAAHYDPVHRTFALAKNAGPGAIAHEWFHALDHYLADKTFLDAPEGVFASSAWLTDATPVAHPLNDLLFACFRSVLLDADGAGPSDLFKAAQAVDERLECVYYSKPEELCARAFEAFVQDHSIRNSFLVKGSVASVEAQAGLYPAGPARVRSNASFRHYFNVLGGALKREAGWCARAGEDAPSGWAEGAGSEQ